MLYAILAAVAIGFGGGWFVASGIGEVNLTQCELNTEKILKAHEKETADRMRDAQTATSRALSHLTGNLIKTQQHAGDLTDELKKHATGRNCLPADARRVLNTTAAQQQRMPEDNHIERFKTSDGLTLRDWQVDDLVNVMADFALPDLGETILPPDYASILSATIASHWG